MDKIQMLQNLRNELIQSINLQIDEIILQLRNEQEPTERLEVLPVYESWYPLTAAAGIFKGKKPIGVKFRNGTYIDVPTWKRVVEVILKNCVENEEYKRRLMRIRGRITGRNRVLLDSRPDMMRSPLKIDEELWVETHYDTESLLRILTTRILEVIGYDYSDIAIAVRNVER